MYVHHDTELTAGTRGRAAWLWSGRKAVVAGRSAAALHGAKWVEASAPADLLYDNRRPPNGIQSFSAQFEDDEVESLHGMLVTTPARTALDIACRLPVDAGVAAIDALARAMRLKLADVELLAQRYDGRRGRRGCGWSTFARDFLDRKLRYRCTTNTAS